MFLFLILSYVNTRNQVQLEEMCQSRTPPPLMYASTQMVGDCALLLTLFIPSWFSSPPLG